MYQNTKDGNKIKLNKLQVTIQTIS